MLPSDDSSDASFDQPFALLRGCHARVSVAQLAAMGQDMAARRGVRWPTG
ncbi:MAG: hypothetical protein ACP5GF_06315 [Thiomonas sp.]